MSAAKTGLHKFSNAAGDVVYAAQITTIEDFNPRSAPPHSKRLYFADLDKQANVVGMWVIENCPIVGGYFIVEDSKEEGTVCRHLDGAEFVKQYKKAN